jgi:hypothetical protein
LSQKPAAAPPSSRPVSANAAPLPSRPATMATPAAVESKALPAKKLENPASARLRSVGETTNAPSPRSRLRPPTAISLDESTASGGVGSRARATSSMSDTHVSNPSAGPVSRIPTHVRSRSNTSLSSDSSSSSKQSGSSLGPPVRLQQQSSGKNGTLTGALRVKK